jgi:outer membrane receptor protein involved in Fe transport
MTAAIAAVLGASFSLSVARAQDAVEAEGSDDLVIVTASRRAVEIREVPFTITALAGDDLSDDRLTSLTEIARFVPGMTVVDQGARGADLMTFRGLNVSSLDASEFLDNDSGGTVATYVGEVPVYVDLATIDLKRVEFLPGPQGTLYGAGTLGGAVRYIPNAPDLDDFGVEVHGDVFSVSHGNDPGYATDAVINAPIVEGKLALRASYYLLDDPGFIDYPFVVLQPGVSNPQPDFNDPAAVAANLRSVEDVDSQEITSGRIALLYTPGDRLSATFNYYDQSAKAGGRTANHRDSFNTGNYESGHRFLEPEDRDTSLFSAEIVVDLGFAELTSATGVANYEMWGQRDQTDLYLDQEWGYETWPEFTSFTHELATEDRLNQEFRLVSTSKGRLGWIAGVFYHDYELDSSSEEYVPGFTTSSLPGDWGIPVPPSDLSYFQANADRLTEQAVYGELTIAATDRLDLIVGARAYEYDTTQYYRFDVPFWEVSAAENNAAEDDGMLGKLGASYAFNDRVLGFVTISEGYRIGGANSVVPCPDPLPPGGTACALPDEVLIKPDRTTNFEVGTHALLGQGNMSLDAAVYSIDWDDVQTLGTTQNGSLPITVNGGAATSKGAELSFAARTAGPWSMRTTYAYNDAKLTTFSPGLVSGADAFAGDRLAGTPEHQFSFELGHERHLQSGWDLGFGYNVTATSDVFTRVGMRNGGEQLGGYSVHSIAVSASKDRWQATLYADNVTDKYAETAVRLEPSTIRAVNGIDVRRYFRNVLRPRTIGLEFRYSIGEQAQ